MSNYRNRSDTMKVKVLLSDLLLGTLCMLTCTQTASCTESNPQDDDITWSTGTSCWNFSKQDRSGEIKSPNHPHSYPNHTDCQQVLEGKVYMYSTNGKDR